MSVVDITLGQEILLSMMTPKSLDTLAQQRVQITDRRPR
jgi:hypothetical protein